jgi:methyl-accepting chemotaxis protein
MQREEAVLMNNLSLRKKLWLCCGSLLVILFLVGGIGFISALNTEKLLRNMQHISQKTSLAAAIQLDIEREKVGGRDALLHGNADGMMKARADFQQDVDALEPLLATPTGHRLVDQIQNVNRAYCGYVDEVIRLSQSGDKAKAIDIFYGPTTQATRNELKKSTADLVDRYNQQTKDAVLESSTDCKRSTIAILLFSCLGLAVGSLLATVLIRSLLASVTSIVDVIEEIAQHNLCVSDVKVTTEDELGHAGRALNKMKGNLAQMVRSIKLSAEQLAAATEEIAMGAKQSSSSASTVAGQAVQAASAMQEMSASVREVAGNAQQAHDASAQSARVARQGGNVAEETLATMSKIADTTSSAAARILELGKSSEKIGNIVAVITEIAGQTNLLALNAAIEAARAGEHGRGFAVVAGEVRRLAERTASATEEIAGVIQTVQDETKEAVEAMEKGNREVDMGVKKTRESGLALSEIINMSEAVGGMVAQIASAASQQEGAVEEINSSVSHISDLTQASSANADQTAAACGNLSFLASEMHRLVNSFNVNESSNSSAR